MRLRHNPKADIAVENSEYVEQDPKARKGHWHDLFGNDNPIHIEIGMGKGNFIMTLASQNPDINYVGIERVPTVLYKALKKQEEMKLQNLVFMAFNADEINEVFEKDEVERIYLNFSDPWPKDRHAKRRLTSDRFLPLYARWLKPDGELHFKTDNDALFAWSVESLKNHGWQIHLITDDWHSHPEQAEDVMTEYEIQFSEQGKKIHKLIATFSAEAALSE